MNRGQKLGPFIVALIFYASPLRAEDDGWAFGVQPYLWIPSVDGTFRYSPIGGAPSTPEVDMGGDGLADNFNAAFMLGAEARKDRWVVMTDFIYVNFTNVESEVTSVNFAANSSRFEPINTTLNTNSETSLSGNAWTLIGGYQVIEGPVDLDLMGGVRYFNLRASTDWSLSATVQGPGAGQVFPRSGTISERADIWDGLFALNGRVKLGQSRWSLPYYADIGAGTSRLTWQASGGLAYRFKWCDISLAYRHIAYDDGEDALIQRLTFTGPLLGFKFLF